jgi:hypothetical protein
MCGPMHASCVQSDTVRTADPYSLQNFFDWRNEGSKKRADRYKKNQKSNSNPDARFNIRRVRDE